MSVKNKGFTLIEIIAVIVILGIIVLLISIPVTKYIENSLEKTYESHKKELENAANNYMIECLSNDNERCDIPVPSSGKEAKLSYKKLVELGYSKELEDPEGEGYCDKSYVTAKNTGDSSVELEYKVCLYCNKYKSEEDGCKFDNIEFPENKQNDETGEQSKPTYNDNFEYVINTDGLFTVFGYIKDKKGNENICSIDVKVDGTAPTGTIYMGYEIYPKENSTKKDSQITITELSKYGIVEGIIIDFDSNITVNKESYVYHNGINIKSSGAILEGRKQAILKITSGTYDSLVIDLKDKESINKISKVQILKKESITSVWTNKDVSVYVEAIDPVPGSGLGTYSYDLGNSYANNYINTYSENSNGTIYIKDLAGNISNGYTFDIQKIDKIAPTCSIMATGNTEIICPKCTVFESLNPPASKQETWYISDVNLSLSYKETTDNQSGIIDYGLDGISKLTKLKITEDTKTQTIRGYAKDAAGNGTTCYKEIKKDTIPPYYTENVTTEWLKSLNWKLVQNASDGVVVKDKNNIASMECEEISENSDENYTLCTIKICLVTKVGTHTLSFYRNEDTNLEKPLTPQVSSIIKNIVEDEVSGYDTTKITSVNFDKNNNEKEDTGCLASQEENPCLNRITYIPVDKVGNKGKKLVLEIKTGYETGWVYINGSSNATKIPADSWCS